MEVDNSNVKALQFLDLIKEVSDVSEIEGAALKARLAEYMKISGLSFDVLKQYFSFYPDRIFRNMYEVGLLNGVVA